MNNLEKVNIFPSQPELVRNSKCFVCFTKPGNFNSRSGFLSDYIRFFGFLFKKHFARKQTDGVLVNLTELAGTYEYFQNLNYF